MVKTQRREEGEEVHGSMQGVEGEGGGVEGSKREALGQISEVRQNQLMGLQT